MKFQKFSDLLKGYMKRRKLTQILLAEKANVSRSYVRDVVGKNNKLGSKEVVEKLIIALELTKEEERIVWMTWLYSKGHEDLMIYFSKFL